jgi:molybdopterin/thiamine biosynthesis adenylyltransferase
MNVLMRYTMTFCEEHFNILRNHLFEVSTVEQAAFVMCNESVTENETRLLVTSVYPIKTEDILEQTAVNIMISASVYARYFQIAHRTKKSFFLVHSHPDGHLSFSEQDDEIEPPVFIAAHARIPNRIHGSLLMNNRESIAGRVWVHGQDGIQPVQLERIRVIGEQYRFFLAQDPDFNLSAFDRHIRAFGEDMQKLLHTLHVGVVGASGTGSPLIEELIRLGVGTISVYDDEKISLTNLTRIHGSTKAWVGEFKVDLMHQMAEEIGFGTQVIRNPDRIYKENVAKTLRDCDVIFGCTDDDMGRIILSQIALRYYIPLIDMGVKVLSSQEKQIMNDILTRITFVQPGYGCLICADIADGTRAANDTLSDEERDRLAKDGYVPGLQDPDPTVITYTTGVASAAVAEFIHRLIGLNVGRDKSRIYHLAKERRFISSVVRPKHTCTCGSESVIGRGDSTKIFLDLFWPSNTN